MEELSLVEFERDIHDLMQLRGIKSEFEAIYFAIKEALQRSKAQQPPQKDFTHWIGCAKDGLENPSPRFNCDDDLWR